MTSSGMFGRSLKSGLGRALALVPTVFMVFSFALIAQPAMAQSTIFNIPSTDTVDKGKGYFEFDVLPQTDATGAAISIFNPLIVVGLPHDVEVGLNFPIFHSSDFTPTSNFVYIQPNLKWKFFKND